VAGVALAALDHVECVLVVDDGSRDGSGAAVRAAAARVPAGRRLEVVVLPENRGKGQALVAGFRRALDLGFTHAVTLDADGQHRASDLPRFLAEAERHPLALVAGAREMDSDRVPHAARVGRRVSNFWTLRSTGFDLPDTTCGFRLYPLAQVASLPIGTRRYDYEGEVLVRAAWAGVELRSLPIDVWYPDDRRERVSHYRPWMDSVRITVMYVRLALRRLLPTGAAGRPAPGVARPKVRIRDTLRHLRSLSASGTHANEMALAIGIGVFLGATPLWGLHAPLALYIATRWRLNLVATFVATNVSFPLIAPFLVFAQVQFGHLLRRHEWLDLRQEEFSVGTAWDHAADYVVGGFTLAAVLGIAAGLLTLQVGGAMERRRSAA
jgi:glycosyltransferase involved in cell wall biosynthesis